MPKIILENINKKWGGYYGVDGLNLEIADNAFVTLLGPSGCGKTTTLRMIAGLETPTSGKITIGDTVVFDSETGVNVPASKRHVGFLFQNYALWPNMTVYQNIVFGLKNVKEEMEMYEWQLVRLNDYIRILGKPDGPDALGRPPANAAEDWHIGRFDDRFADCLLGRERIDGKNSVCIAVANDGKIRCKQKRFYPAPVYDDPAGLIHGSGHFQNMMP